MKTIIVLVYLAIGVAVAAMEDYLGDIGNVGDVINLVLAIVLWPAVLLGVEFNLDIGGDDGQEKKNGGGDGGGKGGDKQGGDKQGGGKNNALAPVGPVLVYGYHLATKARRVLGVGAGR